MRRRLAVVTAVLLLGASGCGDSGSSVEPEPLEPTSGSTAAAPSVPEGVPTEAPEPPAKQADTVDSAIQFVTHFASSYYYALASHDAEPMLEPIPDKWEGDRDECERCVKTVDQLARWKTEGRYAVRPEPLIGDVLQTAHEGDQRVFELTMTLPAGEVIHRDGARKPLRKQEGVRLQVLLKWSGEAWEVWNFGFPDAED